MAAEVALVTRWGILGTTFLSDGRRGRGAGEMPLVGHTCCAAAAPMGFIFVQADDFSY